MFFEIPAAGREVSIVTLNGRELNRRGQLSNCLLLLSFLPWRMNMLTSPPLAEISKHITAFFNELSCIIELPFIIELPLNVQLTFTAELSPKKNEYANFPAFGRDFRKTSLNFLMSCPLLLSCPLSLSYLLLLSCPLLLSFLPWRMNMLTSRPSAGIEKKHHCFSWWAVLCYWAALYCWAAFQCSALLYHCQERTAGGVRPTGCPKVLEF